MLPTYDKTPAYSNSNARVGDFVKFVVAITTQAVVLNHNSMAYEKLRIQELGKSNNLFSFPSR